MAFILDHRLKDSSFAITEWPLCHVRLRNDSTYPWLYLIPRRENIREMFDLVPEDQVQLAYEIARAGMILQKLFSPAKINTAALGNMVPQLHVHIFARFENDPAWPKPVWAVQSDEIPYNDDELEQRLRLLKNACTKEEIPDR